MRSPTLDTPPRRQGNYANSRYKSNPQRKVQLWHSSRSTDDPSERQDDQETNRGIYGLAFLTLTKHTANHVRAKSTGDWFLESPEFGQWYNSSGSAVLWLFGITGSGKTTLANRVFKAMKSRIGNESKPTVQFYLQYEGVSGNPANAIIKSLVNQICAPDTPLKDGFQPQRLASLVKRKCPPTDSAALCDLFRSLLGFLSPVVESFILMDSFDHYPWIIHALISATVTGARDIQPVRISKLFVSYRSSCKALDHCVEYTLASGSGFKVNLDENAAAKTSLTHYIEAEEDRLIAENPEDEPKIRRIVRHIQQRSANSFLWAKLALERVSQLSCSGLEPETLDCDLLPLTLGEAYQQRLDLALSKNGPWTMDTLRWVLYATRPLSVLELKGALLNTSLSTFSTYHDSSLNQAGSGGLGTASISTCGGLLRISENRDVVVAHRTVREYLCGSNTLGYQSQLSFGYIQSHESLAITCLQYLIRYQRAQHDRGSDYSDTDNQSSFRTYAVNHWKEHYRIAEAQSLQLAGLLYEYLLSIYGSERKLDGRPAGQPEHSEFRYSTLRSCAASGFTELCKVMLQMGTPVDFDLVTPLHLAVSNGHLDTVRLLLEHGADIEATTPSGETPLILAVQNADGDIVELLLAFGADMEGRHGETNEYPLHFAAANGAGSLISLSCCNHPLGCKHPETGKGLISDLPRKYRDCHPGNNNFYNEDQAKRLEARSDIGHQSKQKSALHLALENGHIDLFRSFSNSAASGGFMAPEV
ncbi:MAG: hypothetical protein Q9171_006546 [Xanthocarpia ochracea]